MATSLWAQSSSTLPYWRASASPLQRLWPASSLRTGIMLVKTHQRHEWCNAYAREIGWNSGQHRAYADEKTFAGATLVWFSGLFHPTGRSEVGMALRADSGTGRRDRAVHAESRAIQPAPAENEGILRTCGEKRLKESRRFHFLRIRRDTIRSLLASILSAVPRGARAGASAQSAPDRTGCADAAPG